MVNKEGVVINAETGRIMSQHLSNSGYYFVTLNKKNYHVHRIVAILFVKNTKPGRFNIVNHRNENKTDNRAENLEWCSVCYNVNYGNSQKKKANSFIQRSIIAIKDGKEFYFPSMSAASKETGVGINSIRRCIDGKQKSTRIGYSFYTNGRGPRANAKKKIVAVKEGKKFIFESTIEAAKQIGVSRMLIWYVMHGKRKTAKGFSFYLLE